MHTVEDVIKCTQQYSEGTKFALLAPLVINGGRSLEVQLNMELQQGYSRIFYKNDFYRIDDFVSDNDLDKVNPKDIFILIDRMSTSSNKDTISPTCRFG